MHHFHYRNGALHAEDVAIEAMAAEVGTPFYCYATATLKRHYEIFAKAVGAHGPTARHHAFFAMKANSNLAVLKTLAKLGAGADTVSEGEIRRALAAGIPTGKIVFSGVGKSAHELAFAVDQGIYQVNVETESELDLLSKIASAKGRRQAAVIRVNPDVGAGGHAKITTGSDANKFGVSIAEAERIYVKAANLPGVRMLGLATHIGSQILELDDLEAAFKRLRATTEKLRGQGLAVERIDLGGGIGVDYHFGNEATEGPSRIEAYAAMVERTLSGLDVERGFEPGRVIVANAGILVTRVLHLNPRQHTTFAVVDAAMNDLIRPAMYEAHHEIWPVRQPAKGAATQPYDVVGPICESSDTFATARPLTETRIDDLIAFMSAGAYGATMSSQYNSRLLIPEVLVDGGRFAIVRPRPSFEDMLSAERTPGWL
jgi:diaminopimelate decarboxylase